jgi:hypothetical protein
VRLKYQRSCNAFTAFVTTNKQREQGGGVLWTFLLLIVAIGYEAFGAASRFSAMSADDALGRED